MFFFSCWWAIILANKQTDHPFILHFCISVEQVTFKWLGLHNAAELSSNTSTNNTLILALKHIPFHTQWQLYTIFTQEQLLVPTHARKVKERHFLPTLTQGCTKTESFSMLLSTYTHFLNITWSSDHTATDPTLNRIKLHISNLCYSIHVLRREEMDRKWCTDLLDVSS